MGRLRGAGGNLACGHVRARVGARVRLRGAGGDLACPWPRPLGGAEVGVRVRVRVRARQACAHGLVGGAEVGAGAHDLA